MLYTHSILQHCFICNFHVLCYSCITLSVLLLSFACTMYILDAGLPGCCCHCRRRCRLLEKLFEAGVNGKMLRLLKNWNEGGCGQVKLDGRLSDCFPVSRGVRQIGFIINLISSFYGTSFLDIFKHLVLVSPSTVSMWGISFMLMMYQHLPQVRPPQ